MSARDGLEATRTLFDALRRLGVPATIDENDADGDFQPIITVDFPQQRYVTWSTSPAESLSLERSFEVHRVSRAPEGSDLEGERVADGVESEIVQAMFLGLDAIHRPVPDTGSSATPCEAAISKAGAMYADWISARFGEPPTPGNSQLVSYIALRALAVAKLCEVNNASLFELTEQQRRESLPPELQVTWDPLHLTLSQQSWIDQQIAEQAVEHLARSAAK
ncbi:hypothetical protein ACTD5D_40265 [Nocardia takedensis]|uniref:hypothetical protein n=1 Tax=Nocardia takedensis TaxID=259390 RepID=UPI003F762E43